MTAFLSFPYPDRIEILTDGASCLPNGLMIARTTKVKVSPYVPLAVTGRGNHADLEKAADMIILASQYGVDEAISMLAESMAGNAAEAGEKSPLFEMAIAGISESQGARHWYFANFGQPESPFGPVPAWTLYDWGSNLLGGGPALSPEKIAELGLSEADFAENAKAGIALLEAMRRIPGTPFDGGAETYWIGAHVDWTVVSADGVHTERIHEWPDELFQKIEPKGSAAVAVDATSGKVAGSD